MVTTSCLKATLLGPNKCPVCTGEIHLFESFTLFLLHDSAMMSFFALAVVNPVVTNTFAHRVPLASAHV